jgi:hypothetical protein
MGKIKEIVNTIADSLGLFIEDYLNDNVLYTKQREFKFIDLGMCEFN